MKKFVIGLVLGFILGGGIAFAATYNIILQSSDGTAISASNPLPIRLNQGENMNILLALFLVFIITPTYASNTAILQSSDGTAISSSNPLQVTITGAAINISNLGVGTSTANNQLTVNGAVGVGTANSAFVTTVAPAGGLIIEGNVGINSLAPGQKLDVQGTVRSTAFSTSGGYTQTGTTFNNFTGNVGINSAAPGTKLDIVGRARFIGIGTTVPQAACIKADGSLGYYATVTFAGTCN